jgi:3-dehydrosphinganine reductase
MAHANYQDLMPFQMENLLPVLPTPVQDVPEGIALLAINIILWSNMNIFKDKVVWITGGSSGIGKALAFELLSSGATVVLFARNIANLNAAKEELIKSTACQPDQVTFLSLDVTDFEQIQQTIPIFLSDHPVPDLLINCAGSAHPGEFLDLGLDIFHWLMNSNYYGTVHMIKTLLPYMLEIGSGHIVNISSAAGFLGVYGYTAYCASKFAVRGFSDALRSELLLKNIKMSLVFPPDTDTPQLAYESDFKPAITKALAGNAGILSPSYVAKSILKGIKREKYIIVPGLENAFFYHLSNFLGSNVYWLMDFMVKSAAKKGTH